MHEDNANMKTMDILGVPIAAADIPRAADRIEQWIRDDAREYVVARDVHGIVRCQSDPELMRAHRAAGMCVPDGMPIVLINRLYGHKETRRVYGPDLMIEMMQRSVPKGHRHFLFGGKQGVPELLRDRLIERFPGLNIVGTFSPPFRPMTSEEETELAARIEQTKPDILWVGLGTPKQELWMARHAGRLNAKVMVGVGAAFDFHAGLVRQAPRWLQPLCLEWLFRLCMEPRRLWRRYLLNNPRFIYMMIGQLLHIRKCGETETT
jgi:N-acetylglucosaminyldiphosphoundecaprenol N-acetyl-beta-D-mannosaminyltransferase